MKKVFLFLLFARVSSVAAYSQNNLKIVQKMEGEYQEAD